MRARERWLNAGAPWDSPERPADWDLEAQLAQIPPGQPVTLEEHRDLWTSPPGTYALLRTQGDLALESLLVVNVPARSLLIIDDDEVVGEVIQRMLDAGVPVIDEFPSG